MEKNDYIHVYLGKQVRILALIDFLGKTSKADETNKNWQENSMLRFHLAKRWNEESTKSMKQSLPSTNLIEDTI